MCGHHILVIYPSNTAWGIYSLAIVNTVVRSGLTMPEFLLPVLLDRVAESHHKTILCFEGTSHFPGMAALLCDPTAVCEGPLVPPRFVRFLVLPMLPCG